MSREVLSTDAPARDRAAMLRALIVLLSAMALSSCCCFGVDLPDPDANPPPGDADAIAVARAYAQANAGALTATLDGGGAGGGCVSGIASLALDVAVAVATRGHAGGSPATRVAFDPAACVARIVVVVVWAAHAWTAIGAQALDATGNVVGEIGASLGTFVESPPSSGSGDVDVDVDVDELFDVKDRT